MAGRVIAGAVDLHSFSPRREKSVRVSEPNLNKCESVIRRLSVRRFYRVYKRVIARALAHAHTHTYTRRQPPRHAVIYK